MKKTFGGGLLAAALAALLCFAAAAEEPAEDTTSPCPHEHLTETVAAAPSCAEDGETVFSCEDCGEVFSEQIPALGHDYQAAQSTEPTCTEDGGTTYTCSRCGDAYTEIAPALGHDLTTETTTPTCTQDGKTVTTCARCGEATAETLPALGHDYQIAQATEPTCTEDGQTTYACSHCGDAYTETSPAPGHDFRTETIPATCTDDGKLVTICNRCGETNAETLSSTGHQYGEWETIKVPTWRGSGTEQCVCTNCGSVLTRTIAKLTHLPAARCARGDADLDGETTPADARLILRFSVNYDDGLDAEQQTFCDFDGKDGVSPADARFALRVAIGLPPTEPEGPKTPKLEEGYVFTGYTAKDYPMAEKDGVTYIVTQYGYTLIANKTYSLPASYAPGKLTKECSAAFREMQIAAEKSGIDLFVVSGYRSYADQQRIYRNYCADKGQETADTVSARPGHSEHQTGLAIDVNSLYASFAYTTEGRWLAENAWRYGFIIRYPKGLQGVTGYAYEPWHVRYLGKELAEDVYNSGLCLEDYFGITSSYN